MSDLASMMAIMKVLNQGGPGNQFSQSYNPAAQFGPQKSPQPMPQAPQSEPPQGGQDMGALMSFLNPRLGAAMKTQGSMGGGKGGGT